MPSSASVENSLRPFVRDLVAISGLPALWIGRSYRDIAESIVDALWGLLDPDLVYMRVEPEHGDRLELARTKDIQEEAGPIGTVLDPWLDGSGTVVSMPRLFGQGSTHLVTQAIGHTEVQGVVAVASRQADFPTEAQRMLLLFCANQAAIGFENARLYEAARRELHEREQAETRLKELNETLEERVAERTAQVRSLSQALALAEQRERRRLSQVLHDDLQQILFAVEVRTRLMLQDVPENLTVPRERLDALHGLIEKATHTARTLAVELNPPVLRGEGFHAALQWLANHMEQMHGLAVNLDIQETLDIPGEDRRVLLVHFIREFLFNVVKHAGVLRASISARAEQDRLMVIVEDAGQGFDAQALMPGHKHQDTLGLFSIEERLRLFGGGLRIDSAPGRGTRVTIRLPL